MNWFWDNIYLKKEDRSGMFVFICILLCLSFTKWYLMVWYTPEVEPYGEDIFTNKEYTIVEPVNKINSSRSSAEISPSRKKHFKKLEKKPYTYKKDTKDAHALFFFDPNTIGLDSLQLLGLSKYASNNIVKYRSKGGRFNRSNDLQKIYGIDSLLFKNIHPFIQIKATKSSSGSKKEIKKKVFKTKPRIELNSININLADTAEFKKLKGIGPVYANRIVKFRNSLGGYFAIDQIKEVWGISDSLFLAIKPYLTLDSLSIEKRNINLLDKEELVRHPYIDWKKAKVILKYKKMHGDYKSMDDFKKMHGISKAFIDTLNHYFRAE